MILQLRSLSSLAWDHGERSKSNNRSRTMILQLVYLVHSLGIMVSDQDLIIGVEP